MGYTFQKIFLLQTEGFCLVNHPRKFHSHSSILNSQKTVEKAESVVVLYVRAGKKSVWPSWALGVVLKEREFSDIFKNIVFIHQLPPTHA